MVDYTFDMSQAQSDGTWTASKKSEAKKLVEPEDARSSAHQVDGRWAR